jgi:hypothetical protein
MGSADSTACLDDLTRFCTAPQGIPFGTLNPAQQWALCTPLRASLISPSSAQIAGCLGRQIFPTLNNNGQTFADLCTERKVLGQAELNTPAHWA